MAGHAQRIGYGKNRSIEVCRAICFLTRVGNYVRQSNVAAEVDFCSIHQQVRVAFFRTVDAKSYLANAARLLGGQKRLQQGGKRPRGVHCMKHRRGAVFPETDRLENGIVADALVGVELHANPGSPVLAVVVLGSRIDIDGEPVAFLPLRGDSYHQDVIDDGKVDDAFNVEPVQIARGSLDVAGKFVVRPPWFIEQGAAGGVAAEKRPLRAFQDLNVGEVQIEAGSCRGAWYFGEITDHGGSGPGTDEFAGRPLAAQG